MNTSIGNIRAYIRSQSTRAGDFSGYTSDALSMINETDSNSLLSMLEEMEQLSDKSVGQRAVIGTQLAYLLSDLFENMYGEQAAELARVKRMQIAEEIARDIHERTLCVGESQS